jgi:radical SAM superfamily enzyme YgiQ (UPF0313 family)
MKKLEKNKVLLVTCDTERYLTHEDKQVPKERPNEEIAMYPIGLAYLYSCLESKNIDVRLLALNTKPHIYSFNKVIGEIEIFSPDFVGFQMLTGNRVSTYRLIEYIHEHYPNINIVVGGIHATIMYKQLVEKYPFIIAVIGEGEITFFELIKELNEKKPNLQKIDGIGFYKGKEAIRTKPRKLIEDLDILPFPKHELFFKNNKKRYEGGIFTSRGCPMNCSFCCLNPESKRVVRFRDVNKVVDEIEYMVKSFPQITEIMFQDDSFFINNQRVINICNEIIRRKIKMRFNCCGRMKPISKEMVKKLEEAGFDRVCLGIESADPGILISSRKGISQQDIINTFKLFAKSPINLKPFLIVGLPGENMKTIKESARFLKKIQKIKYFSCGNWANLLVVFPGSEVYEIAKSKGMINDDFWLSDKEIPIYTAEHSVEELKKIGDALLNNISFYRIITPKGFIAQFEMIPYIAEYLFGRVKYMLTKK